HRHVWSVNVRCFDLTLRLASNQHLAAWEARHHEDIVHALQHTRLEYSRVSRSHGACSLPCIDCAETSSNFWTDNDEVGGTTVRIAVDLSRHIVDSMNQRDIPILEVPGRSTR